MVGRTAQLRRRQIRRINRLGEACAHKIARWERRLHLELHRRVGIEPWRAVRPNDSSRKKVRYRLALLRLVGPEHIIETTVLADQNDDVLDRRQRPTVVLMVI